MVQAVVRGTRTALVVADLPFGSYEAGPEVGRRVSAALRVPAVGIGAGPVLRRSDPGLAEHSYT
jgi:ketopantoate hydroxymethyltransferase